MLNSLSDVIKYVFIKKNVEATAYNAVNRVKGSLHLSFGKSNLETCMHFSRMLKTAHDSKEHNSSTENLVFDKNSIVRVQYNK